MNTRIKFVMRSLRIFGYFSVAAGCLNMCPHAVLLQLL